MTLFIIKQIDTWETSAGLRIKKKWIGYICITDTFSDGWLNVEKENKAYK